MLVEGVQSAGVTRRVSSMEFNVYVHISCLFTCISLCFISLTLDHTVYSVKYINIYKNTNIFTYTKLRSHLFILVLFKKKKN